MTLDHRIVCVGHCCSFHDTPVDPELPARIVKLAGELESSYQEDRLVARRLREVLGGSK